MGWEGEGETHSWTVGQEVISGRESKAQASHLVSLKGRIRQEGPHCWEVGGWGAEGSQVGAGWASAAWGGTVTAHHCPTPACLPALHLHPATRFQDRLSAEGKAGNDACQTLRSRPVNRGYSQALVPTKEADPTGSQVSLGNGLSRLWTFAHGRGRGR